MRRLDNSKSVEMSIERSGIIFRRSLIVEFHEAHQIFVERQAGNAPIVQRHMSLPVNTRERPVRVQNLARERQIAFHLAGHFSAPIVERLQHRRNINAAEFRARPKCGALPSQIEKQRTGSVSAARIRFEFGKKNLPGPQLQREAQILGIDGAKAEALRPNVPLSAHRIGRRGDHRIHVHVIEFAVNLVGLQKHRTWSIGRQQIGSHELSAPDDHLADFAQRERLCRRFRAGILEIPGTVRIGRRI